MQTTGEKKRFVTDKELSEIIPYTRTTLQTARTRGNGPPFYRRGKRIFYDIDEVMDWLRENRYESTSQYAGESNNG